MHRPHLALAALAVAALAGCASIITGKSQPVTFNSTPTGAKIELLKPDQTVLHEGTTPFTVSVTKGSGYFKSARLTLRVTHAGQPTREVPLKQGLSAWYLFGNLGFGGLIGWFIVDPITGAMYTLPDVVNVDRLDAAGRPLPEATAEDE